MKNLPSKMMFMISQIVRTYRGSRNTSGSALFQWFLRL